MIDVHTTSVQPDAESTSASGGPAASLLTVAALASLSACGGGEEEATAEGLPKLAQTTRLGDAGMDASADPLFAPAAATATAPLVLLAYGYPAPTSDREAARFLQQAQFSSSEAEIADLRSGSYADWLLRQFAAPPGQTGWQWLESRGYGGNGPHHYYAQSYPGDFMIWNQLMTAPDALRKRMALALSEFFVVSLNGMEFNWRSHALASWWDMLARHALGNFRQLLTAVCLHPAMGWYLNTKGNQKADAATGRVPDENFAREVMQLFTIGLYELNPDGTERLDALGQRIETYTQSDVSQLARVFTGYDFDFSDGVRVTPPGQDPSYVYTIESRAFARKRMAFNAALHSPEEKRFLGITIPAGTAGATALARALNRLFNHPNVGPFFARQMIQRLVTSHPSPAYVARVAAAFADNGAGVRGDLRAVWAAILLDDEARSPTGLTDVRWGKLREPMLRIVQWGRTFGATSQAGSWKMADTSSVEWSLGQSPLRSPSVFNYYRPGFVPPGTPMAREKRTVPEFQTVNETTVGAYLNYLSFAVGHGIYVDTPAMPQMAYLDWAPDITTNYTRQLQMAPSTVRLVDHLSLLLCAGQLSASTRNTIINALNATPLTAQSPQADKRNRVAGAIYLIMASADYLIQK